MIVDSHTHMFRGTWEIQVYLDGLKATGVDRCVVLALEEDFGTCHKANVQIKSWADKSGGVIVPFCNVNPRDEEKAIEELRRAVDEDGMKGLKLHPQQQGFSVMADCVLEVLKEAGALKIPVLFHDATLPWVCPTEVAYMAKRCPETIVILGHSGWQNHWRKAVRAARMADNIVCCTSGAPVLGVKAILEAVGAERVVFGSDYPCGGVKTQIYELSKVYSLNISEEEREMILGKNIQQILES